MNAFNRALRERVIDVFDEISERADVSVAVLTGAGKVFCAGADLKDRPDPDQAGAFSNHNRVTRESANALRECAKPIICAVNGAALGAGLGLMAACDIFLASETAVFGMPEIDVGLAGGAAMLFTLFGRSTMRRMMFTGCRLSAAELYRRGIIEACLPPDQLMPEAMKLAAEIAAKAPLGLQYAKTSANMVELGHAASVLGQRLPAGNRVAMLTASGGFGVLLADAASAVGLVLPDPSPDVQAHILRLVPFASARNPVDATAQMSTRPDLLEDSIGAVIGDSRFDALIIMVASGLNLPRLKAVYLRALTAARQRFPDKVVLLP